MFPVTEIFLTIGEKSFISSAEGRLPSDTAILTTEMEASASCPEIQSCLLRAYVFNRSFGVPSRSTYESPGLLASESVENGDEEWFVLSMASTTSLSV